MGQSAGTPAGQEIRHTSMMMISTYIYNLSSSSVADVVFRLQNA